MNGTHFALAYQYQFDFYGDYVSAVCQHYQKKYYMPDLTLYELSELKEEEIKTRLLVDLNKIYCRTDKMDNSAGSGIQDQINMKLFYPSITTYIMTQLKSILCKTGYLLKSIKNNP